MAHHRLSTSYRMNRLFHEDRAALIVPVDHGVVWGRVPALEAPVDVIKSYMQEDVTGEQIGVVEHVQRNRPQRKVGGYLVGL